MPHIERTANGVAVVVGLRVFTNDWEWGTVTAYPEDWETDKSWFQVTLDNGHRRTYNGDRMTTVEPR